MTTDIYLKEDITEHIQSLYFSSSSSKLTVIISGPLFDFFFFSKTAEIIFEAKTDKILKLSSIFK